MRDDPWRAVAHRTQVLIGVGKLKYLARGSIFSMKPRSLRRSVVVDAEGRQSCVPSVLNRE